METLPESEYPEYIDEERTGVDQNKMWKLGRVTFTLSVEAKK
jgi:hypothetical protein